MAEYDGLPLDTPTVIEDNPDYQRIATRTANGGTVQTVAKAGSPVANRDTLNAQTDAALANLRTYVAIVTPTNAQVAAQVKAQAQIMIGVIRLLRNQFDGTN